MLDVESKPRFSLGFRYGPPVDFATEIAASHVFPGTSMTHSDFESAWKRCRQRVEGVLEKILANDDGQVPPELIEPMRYVSLGGGKRFRAFLVYAAGEFCGATPEQLDAPAAAVELIHAYSLTHDDLPCMDDDDLRRGKPTCHIAFDEATAVLAGDALQTLAFSVLTNVDSALLSDRARLRMVEMLAHASGPAGMVGGQILDMEAVRSEINLDQLVRVHRLKTGALINASVLMGSCAGSASLDQEDMTSLERDADLSEYARSIGLAFQVADDILDVTKNSEILGKPAGSDDRMHKATYVSLLGLEAAREQANQLSNSAVKALDRIGGNIGLLEQLAYFVVKRSY